MTPQPQIRELSAQHAVIARASTDRAGMRATVDRAFATLFAELARLGVEPAGAPYIRYMSAGEQLEIVLGVPVERAQVADGRLDQATLPAGPAAVLRHRGPYEELPAACERLGRWVADQGERPSGPFWESYVTNPAQEPDPARRVTEICIPLQGP